jgi:hypothetical protein
VEGGGGAEFADNGTGGAVLAALDLDRSLALVEGLPIGGGGGIDDASSISIQNVKQTKRKTAKLKE